MQYRAKLFCSFLLASATAAAAQDSVGRIDLDAVASWSPLPRFVITGVAFTDNKIQCLENHGLIRISGKTLSFEHAVEITKPPSDDNPVRSNSWSNSTTAIDDETYQNRYSAVSCRVDTLVRQLVRRDGSWISLPVHKYQRNSSPERGDSLTQSGQGPSVRTEPTQAQTARADALRTMGRAARIPATGGWSFSFESSPETCLEAIGNFQVDRAGVQLTFFVPLPGDLNRFVIERSDLDVDHGRLWLTHGDCRWELTVSLAVRREGQWLPIPLAPI
jgi:hypothetical protein